MTWQYSDEEIISEIESRGYTVTQDWANKDKGLDYVDKEALSKIVEKFLNGSWQERKDMYNLIFGDGKL